MQEAPYPPVPCLLYPWSVDQVSSFVSLSGEGSSLGSGVTVLGGFSGDGRTEQVRACSIGGFPWQRPLTGQEL